MITQHVMALSAGEAALLELLRDEPALVENLAKCTAPEPHQTAMLHRLRIHLVRAVGAQRTAAERGDI